MAAPITTGELPVIAPSRRGTSPIGTTSPNTGATAATNSSYATGAFTSGINLQSGTSYDVQNTDYQGIIEFNNSGAITVTLNGAVGTNFTCTILNLGTGQITLSPDSGYLVNSAATLTLQPGVGCQVFFADRAWTAYSGATSFPVVPTSSGPVAHQWVNSYNAATGAFTETQPAFTDISGQITTSQLPAVGLSATITTANLTVGGTNGSMTFTNGILTASTPAT
jgi:hypothetical protein